MFERIVAAMDSDPERGAKVVAAAQELAQQSGSRALVVHVAHGRKTPSISRRTGPASPSTKTRRSWAHTWHCLGGWSTGGRISRMPYRRYICGTRHDVKACRDHAPDLPDH